LNSYSNPYSAISRLLHSYALNIGY